jgi:hypothetical protein
MMSIDLMNLISDALNPQALAKIAGVLGETPDAAKTALGSCVPAVLNAMQTKSETAEGRYSLTQLISSTSHSIPPVAELGRQLTTEHGVENAIQQGKTYLPLIVGSHASTLADKIGSASGVQPAAALSLLGLSVPLALAAYRQTGMGAAPVAPVYDAGEAHEGKSAAWKWLLPLLLLTLVGIPLIWFLMNGGPKTVEMMLPGGSKISVLEGTINHSLALYLADPAAAAPKRFVFDHLNFETGNTTLTPESVATVTNLTAILKAYPNVEGKLEGHTDSTGTVEANQKLSEDRAGAIKASMVKDGIAETRLTTAGFGSTRPLASNETEEGRAKNRRLELEITKK